MKRFFTVLTTIALTATSAQAATSCMDSEEMEAALFDWYSETAVSPKVHREDTNLQLWASEKNGTWTLVSYYESGQSCVVAQGESNATQPDISDQADLYSMLIDPRNKSL
nr:hypothetical protein [Amylibacter sp.]